MARAQVEIVCDGDERVGYGHVRRALTLARRLQRDGVGVRLVGLSERARQLLAALPDSTGEVRVVVFDAPGGIDAKMRAARALGQTTVALDCFGDATPDVNIAVYPHHEVQATKEAFVGFDYILLREEILSLPPVAPSGEARNVLVVLGGGDLLGQGHEAASRLSAQGLEVTLAQGPLASNTTPGSGYRVLVDPPDLPQRMSACDWAVTNGGGCYFEMLYLGKPVYVLPQTDAELKIAEYGRAHGAVLGIGLDGLRAFVPAELARVAPSGPALVDGRGAERISNIIRSLN